ncbi:MAG TPA: fructosamine kinase family protein [Draconibacterium sp.]|nr:fructosamine kinase family protein [Draconibacterium sp.]
MLLNDNKIILKQVEKRLSDVLGQKVKINAAAILGGGCINHASKIETNAGVFFLKWNSNCNNDIFTREAQSLSELRKASDGTLLIPKVFCSKELDKTPAFLVMEYLQPGGSGQDERLGRGLALIHKKQQDNFGFYADNYCGATTQCNDWNNNWIDFYREKRLGFLLHKIKRARAIENSTITLFETLMDRLDALIANNEKASLIHGDLWSGNYMITPYGPALIDPAASYSHREMEFGIITMFGGFSARFFEAYNEIFPLDADWRERNQLYQLYHVLNHYYLFDGGYLQQAISIANKYL